MATETENTTEAADRGRAASEYSGLLSGVRLEKDEHFHNFHFLFPNGAQQKANITEVLLWEILTRLDEQRQTRVEMKVATDIDSKSLALAAGTLLPIGGAR